jgi:hypothetical protein
MSYLGNLPSIGENNSFKILDDISSYTLTFDGSTGSVVSVANDTITQTYHRFITGQRVTYSTTGTAIGGLTSGTAYYIIKNDQNTIKLATTQSNALNNVAIDFTALGTGTTHTLNVAFDGINTKFKATYDNGTKAQITRAAQLQLSINGVIQKPNDTSSPTDGFGFDLDSVIVFSTPPVNTDVFWGNLVANNFPTFDISDNAVDSFTGNGSQVNFTLSKTPANNQNLLVTIDGVVQYPSDAFVTRAYSVSSNVLTFVGAPGNGTDIQVRHIGFAGATSSSVTGFYGRTGNVTIVSSDPVVAIQSGGVAIGTVRTLNFVGTGNTFVYNSVTNTIDISIQGGSTGAAGTWKTYNAGIATAKSVGVNTSNLDVSALTGVGNSFQGIYVSNGMVIMDNTLNGNHYIGTNFNGLMAGPVNVNGALTIDGVWVVV